MRRLLLLLSVSLMSMCSWAQSGVNCDVNNDGDVSITDVFVLVDLLLSGGDDSGCDLDGDGSVSLNDIFAVVDYIFKKSDNLCPDDHHPHMIDLGLPSGTKWACCNVADTPAEQYPTSYGTYYAWGETSGKTTYSSDTYEYYKNGNWVGIGSDIAGTQYDVAHVRWGGSWVMPTKAQQDELRENCTSQWTVVNGVNGRIFKGSNGASIFLPAAGSRWNGRLDFAGSCGYYWSSTLNLSFSYNSIAYHLFFDSGHAEMIENARHGGLTVRPVSN